MKKLVIFDPNGGDKLAKYRGGGRILQILKENLSDSATFVSDFTDIDKSTTLLIPSWNLFSPPLLNKRVTNKQYLMIFDVIPLKYPAHFPTGLRGRINLWRNKRTLKNFDKIITISEHSKKDISQYLHVPLDKIDIIYPAISKVFISSFRHSGKPEARPESTVSDPGQARMTSYKIYSLPSKFCLYVGDVNWNKNLVNLAKAIKLADIPCVFVGSPFITLKGDSKIFAASQLSEQVSPEGAHGSGRTRDERSRARRGSLLSTLSHPWQAEFKSFLEEVGDDKRFIFAGYVEDSELVELYQNAVCNVLVSKDEGFGYTFAEAASQNCPSVLSDIDIFHETAADTAIFAHPDNPVDIAKKIKALLSNETLRNELGKKAYEHATKIYNPDTFTKKLAAVLLH